MRFGLALAMLLCVIVALIVPPAFSKFAQQLERHIPSRTENGETAGGSQLGWAPRGGFFDHKSTPYLTQVRGGSL